MAEHMPQDVPEVDMPPGTFPNDAPVPVAGMADRAASEEGSDAEAVFFIKLHFKGGAYDVPVETGDAISSIFDFVQEVPELDFPRENCKLIHKGKVFRPDEFVSSSGEFKLTPGAKMMLMATSAHDASFVQTSRPDPLVKGFKELDRDERNRAKRARAAGITAWGTKQDLEYRFNKIAAEFKYSKPSPYDAEKLLQKLATDPGIIEIMKSRRFTVGTLTEMSPMEAQERMKKKGTPGVDLLGYNQNAGEMIVLRLRTDNTEGFRPYHDLINTLIHELTHNVWGPHDHNFWKLFGELKAQYMKFHRFWSHGGRAADSNAQGQFQGFAGGDEEGGADFGHKLGGGQSSTYAFDESLTEEQRRERATLAAEARKVTATTGINFLNTGGKMIIVCPCGQVHDPGFCPMSFPADAAPEGSSAGADGMDVDAGPVSSQGNNLAAAALAAPAPIESGAAAAAAPAPVAAVMSAEAGPALDSQEDVEMAAPAPAPDPVAEPSAILAQQEQQLPQEFEQGLASPDVGPLAGLSAEDLEALGLGGASEWLQSFSAKLQALKSHAPPPTARQAIELLLRLVRNVVGSPSEAKFRRIRVDNPKIQVGLLAAGPEVEKLITLLGFEDATEEGRRVYVLRDAFFDSARLRMGQELLEQQLGGATVAAH